MGQLCSKGNQVPSRSIDTEPEVTLKKYKNENVDEFYEAQEVKYNLLSKLNFEDFFYSLAIFSNENATLEDNYNEVPKFSYDMNSSFYSDIFSNDLFQSFIENKIFKHKEIYQVAGGNETLANIFKDTFLKINDGLGKKLKQDDSSIEDENQAVRKIHAIAYGILYCGGKNSTKIKTLFKSFQENGQIKKNELLDKFLLALALIPSYCMANARYGLRSKSEIGNITKDDLKKLIDFSELKDCQNLVKIMNNYLFGDDNSGSLDYPQFKGKFDAECRNSLNFMLTPKGIRNMLIQNNIK